MTKCEVIGLKSCVYKDVPLGETTVHVENKEAVTFSGYTNKMYTRVPEEVTVTNMMDGRMLRIRQRNTGDINLWNPGAERSSSTADLGDILVNIPLTTTEAKNSRKPFRSFIRNTFKNSMNVYTCYDLS